MSSQYLPGRQVVSYSTPKPNSHGQTVQVQQQPATSMYTTPSGFSTFQTVFTPSYVEAGSDQQQKQEGHNDSFDGNQAFRVLMPVYQNASSATGSGSTVVPVKFVEAAGGNSVTLLSASNGYAPNGTIIHHPQQHPQYQTIQLSTNPSHGQVQHQLVNGQLIQTTGGGQGQFGNQVQYIVVQQGPNGSGIPLDIKSELDGSQLQVSDSSIRDTRRMKDANRKRRRRLTESEEEAMARRQKNLEAKRRRLARETDDEKRRRRQRDAEAKRRRRERETEEQRQSRLARDSARMRRTRKLKKLQKDGMMSSDSQLSLSSIHPQQNQQQQVPQQVRVTTQGMKNDVVQPAPSQSYITQQQPGNNQQQTITVVDNNNKHQNMVLIDQKPMSQNAFISTNNGHPQTIQIPSSMVQTVAMQNGSMIALPQGQGGHSGNLQQIILLPPPGQNQAPLTIPSNTQIVHNRHHAESSASSVSSSFITDSQVMLPDDPTERQRIRNKERARRRRANETPEQRALRNRKTAERMRRRRAQIAEQRALAQGIAQPVKVILTEKESTKRFEDIFKSVLERVDYEVRTNGPIVPRPKLPPTYYVNDGNQYVLEQIVDGDDSVNDNVPNDGDDTHEEEFKDPHDDEDIGDDDREADQKEEVEVTPQ